MVAPSGEGAVRCMKMAMATSKNKIDYINTHGTSTPVGDITELKAVGEVFKEDKPKISSTKSLAGHSLGATSVHEALVLSLLAAIIFLTLSKLYFFFPGVTFPCQRRSSFGAQGPI